MDEKDHRSVILIVDDEPDGRELLKTPLLFQGYHVVLACNGQEALDKVTQCMPDLILLDVMMPGMDGFEVCRQIRKNPLVSEIPIVMTTALNDRNSRLEGINSGADDFIPKPFDLTELMARVQTITRLNRYRHLMEERAKVVAQIQYARDTLAQAYDQTLEGWIKALDMRDKETENHSKRVTEQTIQLVKAMGIEDEEELEHIRRGALLHDVGKMAIPDHILHKKGALTDEEMAIMQKHPEYAYEWLSSIAYLRPALDIPYCHHEKWDGTGYPRGLKGTEIPLAARIFAVIDVWDALSHDRPYHKAWSQEESRAYIRSMSGIHFDPDIVEVFLALQEKNSLARTGQAEHDTDSTLFERCWT